jgi:hypothetical protein
MKGVSAHGPDTRRNRRYRREARPVGWCRHCIGEWATARSRGRTIASLQLPEGVSYDAQSGVYRLSNRARQRLAAGQPVRRFREDLVPDGGRVVTSLAAFKAFLAGHLGPSLRTSSQPGREVQDFREQADPPFMLACPRYSPDGARLSRVVPLDTAESWP